MRKLLTLALLLFAFDFVPAAKAENVRTSAALNPQIQVQIGRRRRRRNRDWNFAFGNRVGYGRTFTQDVRIGRRTYRETYQIINGRAVLISRVRLF